MDRRIFTGAAAALGLAISQSLLLRAEVIQ